MGQILHIEGVFGSGKTTACADLMDQFNAEGIGASWYLEEAKDHPISPEQVRRDSRNSDYPGVLLRAWEDFLRQSPAGWCVLDGYALQSTVRFLFDQHYPRGVVDSYFREWASLGGEHHRLIYLHVHSLRDHVDRVVGLRGVAWTNKVVSYVEQTPLGQQQILSGVHGLIEYLDRYQSLCLDLLARSDLRNVIVPAMAPEWQSKDVSIIVSGDLDQLRR